MFGLKATKIDNFRPSLCSKNLPLMGINYGEKSHFGIKRSREQLKNDVLNPFLI